MIEISHNPFRCFAEESHEPACLLQQRLLGGGSIRGSQFGFEVPVQVFVGIDLWRVRWEIENLDLIFALSQPGRYKLRVMHFQVIEDQEDFLAAVGDQALHEANEQIRVHRFFNEPKAHQPLAEIIDRACRLLGAARTGVRPAGIPASQPAGQLWAVLECRRDRRVSRW